MKVDEEEELKKLLANEFNEEPKIPNKFSKQNHREDINLKQLKSLVSNEAKELGVQPKSKPCQAAKPQNKNSKTQKEIKSIQRFATDKVIVVDPLAMAPLEEIDESQLNLVALESLYKEPTQGLELIEKKALKLEGGGTLIFKRVRKKKKQKKSENENLEDQTASQINTQNLEHSDTHDGSIGSENDWDPDEENSQNENQNQRENQNLLDLEDSEPKFVAGSPDQYSKLTNTLQSDNFAKNQYSNPKMNNDYFFLEGLRHAAREDEQKMQSDAFLKKLDLMMENEEIFGLSSSEEEEPYFNPPKDMNLQTLTAPNSNLQKDKTEQTAPKPKVTKREFLENLERDYQARIKIKEPQTAVFFQNLKIAKQSEVEREKEYMRQEAKRTRRELGKKGGRLNPKKADPEKAENPPIIKQAITPSPIANADPNLEVLLPKHQKDQIAEEFVRTEGINSYLKSQGINFVQAPIVKKYQENEDFSDNEPIPSKEEFFGGRKPNVGECAPGPERCQNMRAELLQNYYCIRVEPGDLFVTPKADSNQNDSKTYKIVGQQNTRRPFAEEDYEEVPEPEDLAKRLKRKRGETKAERAKRKAEIKKRKLEVKQKKKDFRERFQVAKKERIEQDNTARKNGIHKGISYHKIH